MVEQDEVRVIKTATPRARPTMPPWLQRLKRQAKALLPKDWTGVVELHIHAGRVRIAERRTWKDEEE